MRCFACLSQQMLPNTMQYYCGYACRPPVPEEENTKLITVTWPVSVPPLCLELALGTRVCAVRVDSAAALQNTVRTAALLAGRADLLRL